jgi:hypothetical protein
MIEDSFCYNLFLFNKLIIIKTCRIIKLGTSYFFYGIASILRGLPLGRLSIIIFKASTIRLRISSNSIGCHGRTASYPTAPAQIPACGTTALGSAEILASVKDKLALPSLLFPAGRFTFVIQSYLPGKCFLCRLRILSAPSSLLEYYELIRIPISHQSPSLFIG